MSEYGEVEFYEEIFVRNRNIGSKRGGGCGGGGAGGRGGEEGSGLLIHGELKTCTQHQEMIFCFCFEGTNKCYWTATTLSIPIL